MNKCGNKETLTQCGWTDETNHTEYGVSCDICDSEHITKNTKVTGSSWEEVRDNYETWKIENRNNIIIFAHEEEAPQFGKKRTVWGKAIYVTYVTECRN
jgi:hypothetical protein